MENLSSSPSWRDSNQFVLQSINDHQPSPSSSSSLVNTNTITNTLPSSSFSSCSTPITTLSRRSTTTTTTTGDDSSSSFTYCRCSSVISISSTSSSSLSALFTHEHDEDYPTLLIDDDILQSCRTCVEQQCHQPSPSPSLCWPISRSLNHNQSFFLSSRRRILVTMDDDHQTTTHNNDNNNVVIEKDDAYCEVSDSSQEPITNYSEAEIMKERFSKLLLGEDMSGGGKGVCTAIAISNAITNLYATVIGHNLRLEPLHSKKKAVWKREMDCLLAVCDYIVEFIPSSQIFQDGKTLEVMTNRPRADIYINLPALQKLDTMLVELLESFKDTEFWYLKQVASLSSRSSSSNNSSLLRMDNVFRKYPKEDKYGLPATGIPCVPPDGLSEKSRKLLHQKQGSASQIHKAAMAINTSILAEMEVPEAYMAALPKNGRDRLGDSIYGYMSTATEKSFSPDYLLFNCLNITSAHDALEMANRVEASMYTWRRKTCLRHSRTSWETIIKDLMAAADTSNNFKSDKNHILASRAHKLLLCLKQRFPELPQTTLDICKIQYNRDVGQAILESYSRVLEDLAFNIVALIDHVLYVDSSNSMKPQD